MATVTTSATPSWSQLKKKEKRRYRRYAVVNSIVRASWLGDDGEPRMSHARVLNVCEGGMALELPEAPRLNAMIRFQSEKHRLVGAGGVRHAYRQIGGKYCVGIEFSDGLRWMPPDDSVQEPISLFGPES